MGTDQVGLLIIRAWIEPGSPRPLRAQLRLTADVSNGLEPPLNLTSPEQVGHAVGAWLASVLSGLESLDPTNDATAGEARA